MLEVTRSRVVRVIKKKRKVINAQGLMNTILLFAFLVLSFHILENIYENIPLKCLPVREQILCYCFGVMLFLLLKILFFKVSSI